MKRIPPRTARAGTRGLPPFGFGGSGGRIGSITSQRRSGTSDVAIAADTRGGRFRYALLATATPRKCLRSGAFRSATRACAAGWSASGSERYAAELRRGERRLGRTWHLDEVVVRIGGEQKYLWRAVDEHGQALDILPSACSLFRAR